MAPLKNWFVWRYWIVSDSESTFWQKGSSSNAPISKRKKLYTLLEWMLQLLFSRKLIYNLRSKGNSKLLFLEIWLVFHLRINSPEKKFLRYYMYLYVFQPIWLLLQLWFESKKQEKELNNLFHVLDLPSKTRTKITFTECLICHSHIKQ